MKMIRCTCIYRTSTADEQRDGDAAITVAFVDPWCPAATAHARVAEARAGASAERSQ